MLPNGSYVWSQSEVTEVVDNPEISIRRFSGSKWIKSIPELDSEFDTRTIEKKAEGFYGRYGAGLQLFKGVMDNPRLGYLSAQSEKSMLYRACP